MATYYERNKDYCIALARQYQAEHKEEYKQYQKEYYQRNKAFLLEAHRLRAKLNPKPRKKKPVSDPKPRGRPRKNPNEPKPEKVKKRPFYLDRSQVVIEPIEPEEQEEEPPIVWVSDRDFVISFD